MHTIVGTDKSEFVWAAGQLEIQVRVYVAVLRRIFFRKLQSLVQRSSTD